MPFPLTHLYVAWQVLHPRQRNNSFGDVLAKNEPQFLLGAIAPDAVHYREQFKTAGMSNIGPAKKRTHLCPISGEKWGQVTDNKGWLACVKNFLDEHKNEPFARGYAAHVITDIHNNQSIWHNFRKNHPEEAGKGYESEYYADMRSIDTRMYNELPQVAEIMDILKKSTPPDLAPFAYKDEINAIKASILDDYNKKLLAPYTKQYTFVSYDDMLNFIDEAVKICIERLA
ncbi:MAG: zinc dependent phospholipase C family protein [Defluviitaleaceae bacterium]|nr:zinc dependent phospholipase C family protein [Defluviitaleaceae bacterium]